MKKLFYFMWGAVLVLSTPFLLKFVFDLLQDVDFRLEKIQFFLVGILLSVLMIRFTSFLQYIYILFHELSHVFSAVLFSARFFGFSVQKDFGYVKADKSNLFIRLSPYLFPLLPFLILTVHFMVLLYFRYYENYESFFRLTFLLVGIFYTSTSFYNFKLLLKETTDIDRNALFISFLLIFNSYFITSALLCYFLFNSELLLSKYYFI